MKHSSFKRLLSFCLVVMLCMSMIPATVTAADFDTENFVGLVLQNTEPDTVTVKLYSGFSATAANLLTPVHTETTDTGVNYYYEVTANSRYYCVAKPTSGYARYNDQYCIYITEEEATQKIVMDVTPQTRSSNGWDPSGAVLHYTDETMTNIYKSDPALWPQYAEMFTTPAFQEDRNQHRQTTQTEMMNFINGLDGDDDNMHVYIIGKSAGASASEQFNIPMVLFTTTDLSSATTLEEAAALVKANGKLTVHYQAQIHGDEQGAGEAALGMIKRLDGEYGESLLDTMNIYVIPRLNPRGAYKSQRVSYLNGSTTDPNRDFMKLETPEVQARMMVYNLFQPEVVFDNHEYQVTNDYNRIKWKDMSLCCHPVPTFTQEHQDTAVALAYAAFDQLDKDGLTYRWYSDSMGSVGYGVGSGNTAYRGSIHILMETDGCDRGLQFYERRVAAHASAVGGILAYLDENADAVNAAVNEQWNLMVENGKTYEEDDIIILDGASSDSPEHYLKGKYILLDSGTIETKYVDFTATYPNVIKRSRPAPTAYVIPAGESYTDASLALADKHGISYYNIPAGSSVNLQQYTELTEVEGVQVAGLTAEQSVTFPNGAYVFTMDQTNAIILAGLMEPDLTDALASTLVGQGYISATDGVYPIYRYVRDLNEDGTVTLVGTAEDVPVGLTVVNATAVGENGKITGLDADKTYEYRTESAAEYTAVASGATEIELAPGKYVVRFAADADTAASAEVAYTVGYETLQECVVYLSGTNGNNANSGLSDTAPVKNVANAFAILDFLMEYADDGVSGKIVLTGNVSFVGTAYTFPAHDYPLIFTSKTGAEGFVHNSGTSAKRYLTMGGDTTLENMTITLKTTGTDNYLCAGGHKLTIENSVKTVANSGGNYFNLMVGRSGTGASGGELTVKGGTWRYVYAGAYQTAHHDSSKVILSDCTIDLLSNSYNYTTDGNIYYELRNVTVNSAIYCGNRYSNHVTGDVTLVLGEGVTSPKIYAGSKAGNITGTVTVIADGIDLTTNTIYGKSESSSGTIGGLKLVLNQGQLANVADSFITRDGVDVVLGCDQTEAVTIPYSVNLDLKGCDAANVTIADGKTATVKDSATDDYTVEDAQGYGILSATGTCVPAEGYVVVEEENGFSYHKKELALTNIAIRSSAAGIYYVGQFGMDEVLREDVIAYGVILSVNPNPTLGGEGCQYTRFTSWGNTTTGNGTLLTGIMKPTNTYSLNKRNAETVVYGRAYLETKDGIVYSEETGFSLRQAVEKADAVWEDLTQSQKDGLIAMYQTYTNVMNQWNIPNIKAAA